MGDAGPALPALAPVVLPRTMREKKVLGTQPGSCIGPQCAHGGLHFALKPLSWAAPPKQAMPAPGQMPSASAAKDVGGMPSLKWQQGPVTWHNEDGVFAKQEHAWAHASGGQTEHPTAAHRAHLHHQQALSAQQRQQSEIIMGNTAPPATPVAAAGPARRKQEAVARLAKKLARQISDTGAPPAHRATAGLTPAAHAAPTGAALPKLKLAGAVRGTGQGVAAGTSASALAGNSSWVDWAHLKTAAVGAARATADTAVHAKDDVAAAGVRVEHRVNPYDAPPPKVSHLSLGMGGGGGGMGVGWGWECVRVWVRPQRGAC